MSLIQFLFMNLGVFCKCLKPVGHYLSNKTYAQSNKTGNMKIYHRSIFKPSIQAFDNKYGTYSTKYKYNEASFAVVRLTDFIPNNFS